MIDSYSGYKCGCTWQIFLPLHMEQDADSDTTCALGSPVRATIDAGNALYRPKPGSQL